DDGREGEGPDRDQPAKLAKQAEADDGLAHPAEVVQHGGGPPPREERPRRRPDPAPNQADRTSPAKGMRARRRRGQRKKTRGSTTARSAATPFTATPAATPLLCQQPKVPVHESGATSLQEGIEPNPGAFGASAYNGRRTGAAPTSTKRLSGSKM